MYHTIKSLFIAAEITLFGLSINFYQKFFLLLSHLKSDIHSVLNHVPTIFKPPQHQFDVQHAPHLQISPHTPTANNHPCCFFVRFLVTL